MLPVPVTSDESEVSYQTPSEMGLVKLTVSVRVIEPSRPAVVASCRI